MQEAAVLSVQQYQEACNLTEAPIDDVSRERWKKVWKPAISLLRSIAGELYRSRVDALKKFAAYGKIPDDLTLIGEHHKNSLHPNTAYPTDDNDYRLLHAVLGMVSEVEEIICCFVKGSENRGNYALDYINFGEELGDFNWYAGLGCNATGLSLQKILEINHEKLVNSPKARYKQGFTEEAAINRDLPAERAVLEAGTPSLVEKVTILKADRGGTPYEARTPTASGYGNTEAEALADLSSRQSSQVEAALVAETRRTHCPDCKTALKHINSRVGPFSYCPKCEPEDGEEEEIIAAPDPSAFCTYCDIHGHDRSACPQLAPAYAAPLMIEPLDGDEEPLTPPDSNPAPKGARPQIRNAEPKPQGRFQQDGGFAGFRQ